MTWWQILLVFIGIPAGMFVAVTVLVLRFATARVPDGLARVAEHPGPQVTAEDAVSATEPPSAEPERQPTGE